MDDATGAPAGADPQPSDSPLKSSVLVLNKHYVAVRVVSARRAFVFMCKNYAEAIDASDDVFTSYSMASWMEYSNLRLGEPDLVDEYVRTPRASILVPRVIRLLNYDKVPRREVKFNRRNIMARDGNRCQYCGRKLSVAQLSIDHVVPKSRGGKSSWLNVVTACNPCNTRKGGRMPAEASMRLLNAPSVPKRHPLVEGKLRTPRYGVWGRFLGDGELANEA